MLTTLVAAMFAVPKYSAALEELRQERNVEGLFQHNLVAVDPKLKVATFKNLADGGKEVQRGYDFLHVVPPQKPWDFVAKSALGTSFPLSLPLYQQPSPKEQERNKKKQEARMSKT